MTIVNIRGTSGSGKSTLVHRLLRDYNWTPIQMQLGGWKKPRTVAYVVNGPGFDTTFVVGRYESQCGGCDAMSYKGSHPDIERLVRQGAEHGGNVVFEGLTVSSTYTRWQNISKDYPGKFVWAFMSTPEEECYRRILARSGREPKRDAKGRADYNRKHHGCQVQMKRALKDGERVVELTSDDEGYAKFLELLGAKE